MVGLSKVLRGSAGVDKNTNLAEVRDDQEESGRYEHIPSRISVRNSRSKQNGQQHVSPNKNPYVSIVDNRVDNSRVQHINITHNYQTPPNQQANRQTYSQLGGNQRTVSFLLGVGILFLPFIFAWFTLRDGHSTLSRVVSFVWLGLFMFNTCADMEKRDNRVRNTAQEKTILVDMIDRR